MTTVADTKNVIYGLSCTCHPEKGVRYIGKTVQTAEMRLRGHKGRAREGCVRPVYDWIRKHGSGNIETRILEALTSGDLYESEQRWITTSGMRVSDGKGGLNLTDGGPGAMGLKFTSQQRANASAAKSGIAYSQAAMDSRPRKLNDEQVVAIKSRLWDGAARSALAREYSVSTSAIANIYLGTSYPTIPWPTDRQRNHGERFNVKVHMLSHARNVNHGLVSDRHALDAKWLESSDLHIRDIRRVRSLRLEGAPYDQIVAAMPAYVTRAMVGKICRAERWAHVI